MKIKNVIGAAVLIGIGITAQAQEMGNSQNKKEKPTPEIILSKLDVNKDQRIDKNEAKETPRGKLYERFNERFNEIDTNADGFITLEELKAIKSLKSKREKNGKQAVHFQSIDKNEDGFLNFAEVKGSQFEILKSEFTKIDTNSDGRLHSSELRAFADKRKS